MYKIFKFNRMFKQKKAYSTGFAWIFALVSLFGLGLLFIVFNQVLTVNLVPVIKNMVNDSTLNNGISIATQNEVNQGIDKYMAFFNILPFVLFFVIIIYMIVVAIRKEGESEFR